MSSARIRQGVSALLVYTDYEGNQIRLPDERIRHISQNHAKVFRISDAIEITLSDPDSTEPSGNNSVKYYRYFERWNRHVLVVVAFRRNDAFVLTARTIVER